MTGNRDDLAQAADRPDPAGLYGGRRVLITGGLGFLGSNLAHRLVGAGAAVTLVDSLLPDYGGNHKNIDGIADDVRVSYTDVRDQYAMAYLIREHEFIFNFAGQVSHRDSMDDPLTDLEINAKAPLSLLEAARRNNLEATVIFAGTRQVYGRPKYLPVDEDHPLAPTDANGISNLAGELYHFLYASVHGMRAASLRMTNTYGPRQRLAGTTQAVVPIFVRQALEDETITLYGGGDQLRDFVYVDDAVDAFLLAGQTPGAMGRPMNMGHPDPMSLREFCEILCDAAGSGRIDVASWPPEYKKIDIGDYYGSYELARRVLGWEPKTSVRDGIERTVAFYRANAKDYL